MQHFWFYENNTQANDLTKCMKQSAYNPITVSGSSSSGPHEYSYNKRFPILIRGVCEQKFAFQNFLSIIHSVVINNDYESIFAFHKLDVSFEPLNFHLFSEFLLLFWFNNIWNLHAMPKKYYSRFNDDLSPVIWMVEKLLSTKKTALLVYTLKSISLVQ